MNAASRALPADLKAFMPDKAPEEVRHAGRCLAFGLYTASGFHMCRAVEVVLEAYYQCFSGSSGTLHGWHAYISALGTLASSGAGPAPNDHTIAYIDQLRQSDRNPIMHPRVVLNESDALNLFNLGLGIMGRMAEDIRATGVMPLATPSIGARTLAIGHGTPAAISAPSRTRHGP